MRGLDMNGNGSDPGATSIDWDTIDPDDSREVLAAVKYIGRVQENQTKAIGDVAGALVIAESRAAKRDRLAQAKLDEILSNQDTLLAWRSVTAGQTLPALEQDVRTLHDKLERERKARLRAVSEVKEDVADITGPVKAITSDMLTQTRTELATMKERRHKWAFWAVGFLATTIVGAAYYVISHL